MAKHTNYIERQFSKFLNQLGEDKKKIFPETIKLWKSTYFHADNWFCLYNNNIFLL
jgi:hypothetical protein